MARTRPKKEKVLEKPTTQPADVVEKRGRGRPKGSTNKVKKDKEAKPLKEKKPRRTVSELLNAYRSFMRKSKPMWNAPVTVQDDDGKDVESTVGEAFRKAHPEKKKGWYCMWVSEQWKTSEEKVEAERKRKARVAAEAKSILAAHEKSLKK